MMADTVPPRGPPIDDIEPVFDVRETYVEEDRLLYVGEPRATPEDIERRVWPLFRDCGYEVRLDTRTESEPDPITGVSIGTTRHVLVAEPRSVGIDGIPWKNVLLAVVTILSTLVAGAAWYYIDIVENPLGLLNAWPFALAVLGVLGVHEFGHYAMSRYHDVPASLPYFIPFPTLIGTMGAVIRMRGRIPDRRALFDIGVAGPLAGLGATVVVTVVGLYLPPVTAPPEVVNSPGAVELEFGYPLLLQFLSWVTGQPLAYQDPATSVNPVVFGGWVGLFVTFLNLLPVGQLDGGHIVRAMAGEYAETIGALVPAGLFGLAGALYLTTDPTPDQAIAVWIVWGLLTLGLAYAGPADPIEDGALDRHRLTIGALTLVLGVLCFTPVPFRIVGA